MKTIYFLILMFIASNTVYALNEIPNASFENWTNGNPDGWETSNVFGPGGGVPITQATPASAGSFAVKGQAVVLPSGTDTLAPILRIYNFPVSERFGDFMINFKVSLVNGNKLYALMFLYNGDLLIGQSTSIITDNADVFTLAGAAFNYFGHGVPTSATIIFQIITATGEGKPDPASYFIVDNLVVTGLTANQQWDIAPMQVYPVPAHDVVNVKGSISSKNMQLVLMDAAGRLVRRDDYIATSGTLDAAFNLQGIAPGLYSLLLIADDKTLVRKIVVQ